MLILYHLGTGRQVKPKSFVCCGIAAPGRVGVGKTDLKLKGFDPGQTQEAGVLPNVTSACVPTA